MELMKQISSPDYIDYKKYMIPGSIEVIKEVSTFIYGNISCQVESFKNIGKDLKILRVESGQAVTPEEFPSFIRICKEITGIISLNRTTGILHVLFSFKP